MNLNRVLLGGLAGGLVMNIIDAVTNGVLLGERWRQETEVLNPALLAKATGGTMGWIIVDFLTGIVIVWVYAAIRPRFGPGPRTAAAAALVVWFASHLAYASYAFQGLFSWGTIMASSLGGLLAALAGGYVGARLYRERA